jgi:N-acetylglutamate synthase-like GNAT family acetyltransferase
LSCWLPEARLVEIAFVPALESDFPAIKALIYETGINPISLDWHRFTVAKTPDGQFIGCGQLKPHGDGTVELASIAVVPGWRKKGVASGIIQKLMAQAPRPLYLTCISPMGRYYQKFGFRAISGDELPKYFRRLSKIAALVNALHLIQEKMLVMRLD